MFEIVKLSKHNTNLKNIQFATKFSYVTYSKRLNNDQCDLFAIIWKTI